MYKNWNDLENACLSCQNCGLCQGRHHVVFGTGPREAQVMFVGEGPGENEDLQGEPFVGRGGQFLTSCWPRWTWTGTPTSTSPTW